MATMMYRFAGVKNRPIASAPTEANDCCEPDCPDLCDMLIKEVEERYKKGELPVLTTGEVCGCETGEDPCCL